MNTTTTASLAHKCNARFFAPLRMTYKYVTPDGVKNLEEDRCVTLSGAKDLEEDMAYTYVTPDGVKGLKEDRYVTLSGAKGLEGDVGIVTDVVVQP